MLTLLLVWSYLTAEPPKSAPIPVAPAPVPTVSRYAAGCRVQPDGRFERDLIAASLEFGIRAEWLAVTVWTESGCNPYIRGSGGEIGLVQIHPRWWRRQLAAVGITDLWNPRENLRAGAYALSRLSHHGPRGMFRRYNGKGPAARRYAERQLTLLAAL